MWVAVEVMGKHEEIWGWGGGCRKLAELNGQLCLGGKSGMTFLLVSLLLNWVIGGSAYW